MRGGIPIQGDHPRGSMLFSRPGKEPLGGCTDLLVEGYSKEQVMEILLGVAMKTISNYLDHINPTPIDAALKPTLRSNLRNNRPRLLSGNIAIRKEIV